MFPLHWWFGCRGVGLDVMVIWFGFRHQFLDNEILELIG